MPMFYSISDGLIYGIISWTVVKIAAGKAKDVSALIWVLDVLFILKLVLI
jgi:AGZA family xanthine/uracil permease-like MFS transporter